MTEIRSILSVVTSIAMLLLGVQSLRLFLHSKVKSSLIFSAFYTLFGLLSLLAALLMYRSGQHTNHNLLVSYFLLLAGIHVIGLYLLAYSTVQGRIKTATFISLGLVLIFVLALSSAHTIGKDFFLANDHLQLNIMNTVVAAGPVLILCALAFISVRRIGEISDQPLPTIRLICISLTVIAAAAITIFDAAYSRSLYTNTLFCYIICMLSVVLVLLSLLTPVGNRSSVQRAIY